MRKLLLLLIILAAFGAAAQKSTETLEIKLPEKKIPAALYSSVRLIDKRVDTNACGIIQLGAFNRKARVIVETPLQAQLTSVMSALTDGSAKNEELILLLRQFSLAEVTAALSENGYCYLRAMLFGSARGTYHKLASIDTVITISSLDVTKALLRRGRSVIPDFISDNLQTPPTDTISYALNDIVNIDSLEKRNLFIYNATNYKTGAYKSFESFVKQQPDEEELYMEFWKQTGHVKSVQFKNKKGKYAEMQLDPWYAFVYDNKLYINTHFGVYDLEKRGYDFYFTGKARTSAKAGDVIAAQLFFGILGGLMASTGGVGLFEMKIDHLTGGFIHLKEIN